MKNLFFVCCAMLCAVSLSCERAKTTETVKADNSELSNPSFKVSLVPIDTQKGFDPAYQSYIDFFEEVYDTMAKNYYQPVSRENFDRFIDMFNEKIYAQLTNTGKSVDFVKWRSTAFLIDFLKGSEDVFSAFYPPKPAKEYEHTVLGTRIDLGIEGNLTDQGFLVEKVELRSDAFEKGLRRSDVITRIAGQDVLTLAKADIDALLEPLEGEITELKFFDPKNQEHTIEVVSKEYFKEMLDIIPTTMPGVYGLKLIRFNRKTAEDMLRLLQMFKQQQPNGPMIGFILDLRDNPGGPPLAAREISSFFLPPGDVLTYFKKHDQEKIELDVPNIPEEFHVRVPMVILINEQSGSAAEMFAGVMQRKGRAVLMGENSAGQVMLKSMFHFDDDSMLLLITQRGHYPDGDVFSFSGLTPDRFNDQMGSNDIVDYASKYLLYISSQNK